jgi:gliding motility-associated-like protein
LTGDTSVFITVYDHPVASFEAAPMLVYLGTDVSTTDPVHFINRSIGAEEFLWSFGDGHTSPEKNPQYVYKNEGFYTVTLSVWNEHGCQADTIKENFIEARRGGFIEFPNTFAPRADNGGINTMFGVNANFRPQYQDVETFKMQIFNRWGQLMFETTDINVGWDGTFNGTIAPEGLYTWVSKGRFVSGKEYTKTGQVLILK